MNWNYPTAWNGKPTTLDNFTRDILIVVQYAGKTISYQEACIQIDELVKKRIENGQSNK